MKRIIPAILISAVILSFAACSKQAAVAGGFDWPQWRGPNGDGQSRETEWDPGSIANPRILWTSNVGMGRSNVVIQDGKLYTAGRIVGKFTAVCLDAATGRRVWQRPLAESVREPQSTPCVRGRELFVLSYEGILHRLDSLNGTERWRKDLVADHGAVAPYYGFACSPIVVGDVVVLTANTAGMALSRDSGDLSWTSDRPSGTPVSRDTTGTDYSTPLRVEVDGRKTVLVYSCVGLSSVDPGSGRVFWQYHWDFGFQQCADPVVIGDRILLVSVCDRLWQRKSVLLETTPNEPRVIWSTPDLVSDITTPVVIKGFVYGCNGALHSVPPQFASLRCLELSSGRMLWEERLPKFHVPTEQISLTAANGTLILIDEQGTLYTAHASPDGYEEIARCDVLLGANRPRKFWTPPVLCNGRIYCRNYAGDLVCIDVSK